MARFLEVPDGQSIRLINLAHVREAHYMPTENRLSLQVAGNDGEHIVTLEGPAAELAYRQLCAAKD